MIANRYSPYRAPDTVEPAPNWRTQAACARLPKADAMFPAPTDTDAVTFAKQICRQCPVRGECLDDALAEEGGRSKDNRFGIRAGLTPSQRHTYYRRAREPHDQSAM